MPQESLFYWVKGKEKYIINDAITAAEDLKNDENFEFYSAFTVAELGEMLPNKFSSIKAFNGKGWTIAKVISINKTHSEEAETEADARAKMLIYLIENNLINLNK